MQRTKVFASLKGLGVTVTVAFNAILIDGVEAKEDFLRIVVEGGVGRTSKVRVFSRGYLTRSAVLL